MAVGAGGLRVVAFGLALVGLAAGSARAETFDPAALITRIAQMDPSGKGSPARIVPAKDGYARDMGLKATVYFDAGTADQPLTLSYWVFGTPGQMLAATEDDRFIGSYFEPSGSDASDWGTFGYTGPGPDAQKEEFQCTKARDPTSRLLNANCAAIDDGRQTLVLGSLTGRTVPADVPDMVYMYMLSEMSAAAKVLAKAEQAVQAPAPERRSAPAAIDPGLVGVWQTDIALGNGWARLRLEITDQARYALSQDGVFSHSGRFEARDGQWRMTSETNGWLDFGRYQLPDATTFNMMSQLGPSTWRKVGG